MKQGVMFLMLLTVGLVLTGVVQSCELKREPVVITDDMLVYETNWDTSISNPDNEEFVNEVAFNLDKSPEDVTQEEFNERYNNE